MEEKNNRSLWIVLAIIVGLFLSCSASALVGGAAGYLAGKKAASANMPMGPRGFRMEPQHPKMPRPFPSMPRMPEQPMPEIGQGGALITDVVEGSPAARAGLRVGDIIVAVDGEPLKGTALEDLLLGYDPGDLVELGVVRNGRLREIPVELGRHPEKGGETPWLGILYQMLPEFRHDFD